MLSNGRKFKISGFSRTFQIVKTFSPIVILSAEPGSYLEGPVVQSMVSEVSINPGLRLTHLGYV